MSGHSNPAEPGTTRADDTACCEPGGHGLTADELSDDVRTLAAAGNETRYEALRYIADEPDGVCVCELEPALGVTQGAVSQALSRLSAAGLLTRRKEGRWRYYSATRRAERLLRLLDETREGASTGGESDA